MTLKVEIKRSGKITENFREGFEYADLMGMPYPPDEFEVTDLYFFYGWKNYKNFNVIRRRTRSTAVLVKATDVDDFEASWTNKENLNYISF